MFPDDAWPNGDLLSWSDDDERVVWDFTAEPYESRPYTDAEHAAADVRAGAAAASAGRADRIRTASAALTANQKYLAIPSPTSAQTSSQVKALTRQMNTVIELVIDRSQP